MITGPKNSNLVKCFSFIKESATMSFFASEYFYRLGEERTAIEFLKSSVSNGVNYEMLQGYPFVGSLIAGRSDLDKELFSLWQKYEFEYLDLNLYLLIDNLYTFDQEIRTQGSTIIKEKEIYEIKEVDKYVFDRLKEEVLLNDKISEKRISVLGTYKLYILLLHNLTHIDKIEFDEYEGILKKAIVNGQFNPNYYASILDRRNIIFHNAETLFYEYNLDKKVPTNMCLVDSLRYQIGLSPLSKDTKRVDSLFNYPCCQ